MYLKIKSKVLRFIKTWIELVNGLGGQEKWQIAAKLVSSNFGKWGNSENVSQCEYTWL